jgi:hypothetical protein
VNPFASDPVPHGVVTETLAAPAAPAGVTAVSCVVLTTFTEVAATPPIETETGDQKSVPVIVTVVPPEAGPEFGEMPVTVGAA